MARASCMRFDIIYNLQRDISTWTVAWTIEIQSIWRWYHIITCINRSVFTYIYIYIHTYMQNAGMYFFDINSLFFTALALVVAIITFFSPGEHDGRVAQQRFLSRRILGVLCTLGNTELPSKGKTTRCWENRESRLVWEKCWEFVWVNLCVWVCVCFFLEEKISWCDPSPSKKREVWIGNKHREVGMRDRRMNLWCFLRVISLAFRIF